MASAHPPTPSPAEVLWGACTAALAALRAALDDYQETGSPGALRRAITECDGLSSSAARIARTLAAAPRACQASPVVAVSPALPIDRIVAWLRLARKASERGLCPTCEGVRST